MPSNERSLNQQFADLHAHRVATMNPADLKINVDQRRRLVEASDRSRFVKAGDVVAPFELSEVDGDTLTLDGLTVDGPLVLIFFRFANCPACNIALPYYNRHLAPKLAALGVRLVGVSPQIPERLVEIKRRHGLDYSIATDTGNRLARRFGILYAFDEPSRQAALAKGTFIGDVTGTGTWELPMPAVVLIDRRHIVRFAEVSPDWLVRTEAETILEAIYDLAEARAIA